MGGLVTSGSVLFEEGAESEPTFLESHMKVINMIRAHFSDIKAVPELRARLQRLEDSQIADHYALEQRIRQLEETTQNHIQIVSALQERLDVLVKRYAVTVGQLENLQMEHEIAHPKRQAYRG